MAQGVTQPYSSPSYQMVGGRFTLSQRSEPESGLIQKGEITMENIQQTSDPIQQSAEKELTFDQYVEQQPKSRQSIPVFRFT